MDASWMAPLLPLGSRLPQAHPSEWRRRERRTLALRTSDLAALEALGVEWGVPAGTVAWALIVEALYTLAAVPGEADRLARLLARAAVLEPDRRRRAIDRVAAEIRGAAR